MNYSKLKKQTILSLFLFISVSAAQRVSALVIDDGVVVGGGEGVIASPHSTVAGKTIAQWGEEWWKWVLGTPNPATGGLAHPQFDTTGDSAQLGNVGGPVFFLAGNFGGTSERTFSAPQGQYFLLPLVNTVWIPDPGESVQDAIDGNAAYINGVISLNASIDGIPVPDLFNYRETTTLASGGFSFTVPENGLVNPGTYGPTAQDGYWLLLTLNPGQHTISFGGQTVGSAGIDSFQVTDHIHVVPVPAAIWLLSAALAGLSGVFGKRRRHE